MKGRGSNTEPWGTPVRSSPMNYTCHWLLFFVAYCLSSSSKVVREGSVTPYACKFATRKSWFIVSKALERSEDLKFFPIF